MNPTTSPQSHARVRSILLILTLTTLPLTCCGGFYTLSALPGLKLGLFEVEVRVENRAGETLYLTPITTTQAGGPQVIRQPALIRQRDIPLEPGHSIVLTYDAADYALAGVAVCRKSGPCRVLANDGDPLYVDSFEALPNLDSSWHQAIQSTSPYRFGIIVYPLLGFVPVILFLSWLWMGRQTKKPGGTS